MHCSQLVTESSCARFN